jgi:hypothetical protein
MYIVFLSVFNFREHSLHEPCLFLFIIVRLQHPHEPIKSERDWEKEAHQLGVFCCSLPLTHFLFCKAVKKGSFLPSVWNERSSPQTSAVE